MKHLHRSYAWTYKEEPFPAFRAELIYGRNKRDRKFIPVQGVTPIVTYTVTAISATGGRSVPYSGTDKAAAEAAREACDRQQDTWASYARLEASPPTLPDNQFRVIRTRDGTIMIVDGEDTTNRCLLFVHCRGGFRGGVDLLKDEGGTTATLLAVCAASNACESTMAVAALLDVGQQVVFRSYGRRTDEVRAYKWDGISLTETVYPYKEWQHLMSASSAAEEADIL